VTITQVQNYVQDHPALSEMVIQMRKRGQLINLQHQGKRLNPLGESIYAHQYHTENHEKRHLYQFHFLKHNFLKRQIDPHRQQYQDKYH
jgi:hypothetical protein